MRKPHREQRHQRRDERVVENDDAAETPELGSDIKHAATLSSKRMTQGMSLLAVVADASGSDVTLHLPNGLKVVVDAANVSDVVLQRYRDALAKKTADDNDDNDSDDDESENDDENDDDDDKAADEDAVDAKKGSELPVLRDFVSVDAVLPCVVISGARSFKVSLLASRVNEGLSRGSLAPGMSLAGAVRSIEDRGYDINLGLGDESRAFLPRSADVPPVYRVGEPLLVFVSSVPSGRAPVQLTTSPSTNLVAGSAFLLRSLHAGALVKARVLNELPNGLTIGFAGHLVGTIESTHLPSEAAAARVGTSLKARVLFVDHAQKRIALSALPHLMQCQSAAAMIAADALQMSSVVDATVVERIRDVGVVVRLDSFPHRQCFVPQNNLADAGTNTEGAQYAIGSEHRVRLLNENRIDGALLGVMRASALANPIALLSDAQPGQLVSAVISRVLPRRLEVKLADGVFGVVPLRYMADVTPSNPEARFKPGQVLKCRVKTVDLAMRRIVLTAKPTMVESALPIITTFEEAAVGTLAHGTVSRIWPDRGVFVEFYGNIGGFVPLKELSVVPVRSAAAACTDGQVVRCRVLAQRADKRLLLTLLTLDESHATRTSASGLAAASALNVRAGSFVDGVVTQVAPNFVYVRLALDGAAAAESSVVGVLQLAHTADVAAAQRLPAMGARLAGLLVLRIDSARVLLSQKPLLVAAVRANALPTSAAQVKVNTVLVGVVSAVKSFGVFVAFGDQLSGLAPPFELQDDGRRKPEQLFAVGQTVRAFVRNVSDNEAHGAPLQLSLRPSLCASAPGAYLGALLEARGAPPAALRPGATAKASVLARGADGSLKLQLPDAVVGTVAAAQVRDDRRGVDDDNDDDGAVRVGDKVTCVVLDFDPQTRVAVASLRASLLAAPKKKSAPPAAGSDVRGVVEAVSDAYCVLSLPAHPGLLLYATSHDYNYREPLALQLGARVDGIAASGGESRLVVQLPLPAARTGAARPRLSERSIADIKPGMLVDGDVISSGDRYAGVSLGGAVRGRLYMTEVSDDVEGESPLAQLAIGQTMRFKVLYIDDTDTKVKSLVQLTMRPSELARGDAPPQLLTAATLKVGQLVTARVRLCDTAAHHVLVVLSPLQKATVDFLDCGVHPSQALPGRFRVGAGMRCVVLSTDGELPQLALSSTIAGGELAVGSAVMARVTAVEGSALRLRLPRGLDGVVPGAPALAIGQYVECKVTGVRRGEPLTLALLDASAAEAAADAGGSHVAQGASDALGSGDLVDAVVVRVDDGGVYVRIADSIDGFSPAREAADDPLNESQLAAAFPSGTTVRARVLTINRSAAHATVALKRSSVSGAAFLRFEDLKRGLLVHGRIASVTDYGVFAALDFSDNLVGLCHARNLSDTERFTAEQMRERFTRGSSYHFVVAQVREKDRKFALALKESLVGPALAAARASGQLLAEDDDAQNGGTFVAHDESDSSDDDDGDDIDVDAINAKRARHDADDDDDDNDDDGGNHHTSKTASARANESRPRKVSVSELDSMLARTSASFDEAERQLMAPRSSSIGSSRGAAGGVGVSFDDIDADVATSSSSVKKRAITEAAVHGDALAADGDAEVRKRPRNVQAASLRREEEVLARERELADGTGQVLTETDHERAVTLEPSSARAWIAFMSFHAANGGIEAARAVSARALKSIPMSKEAVRLDVWLALLALELNFGDAESLDGTFKRAARQNDAETVHLRMAALYDRAERPADAVGVLQVASKKFADSLAVWEALGRLQLVSGDHDGFHATMQRAVAALPARDQLTLIGRYARLEYEFGSVERGRTLFEGVIANHPKRIDQWNVYADMEIKFGDAASARRVFERLAAQHLSSKKMRAALKQWLKFEQQHGTEADAERVRQKARDFVQAQSEKDDE